MKDALEFNGHTLEYIDSAHLYLYDGIIIPSVTQLLKKKFDSKYDNIPQRILNDKAEFGTKVHKYIEEIENGGKPQIEGIYEKLCIEQYMNLKEKHKISSVYNELLICCEGEYAGRLDMIADINYYRCLCDIKTTAKLDKEYLSWQLSLYEYAYYKMTGDRIKLFYCIWLPKKELGELVEVDKIPDKEIEQFLAELKNEDYWKI